MLKKYTDILNNLKNKESETQNTRILLVDGLNLFLRSFCATNLTNQNGNNIGGIVGSLLSLGYAIKLINPTKVIICFDGQGGSNNRKNLYPEYKANRNIQRLTNYGAFHTKEEEQESIFNQINRLIYYLQCLPLTLISIDGLEADDLISYNTNKYSQLEECKSIIIMSADQDFMQLVSEKIHIYSPVKKKIYTPKMVLEEYKIHPNNFLIYKTLMGDNSDNLPGINGLGPKKLEKLFPELKEEKFFSLNEVFEKSQKGNHKLFETILERKKQCEINFTLMNLTQYNISAENIKIIEKSTQNEFNKPLFLQMYYGDLLGESIKNVENWINLFQKLEFYENNKGW